MTKSNRFSEMDILDFAYGRNLKSWVEKPRTREDIDEEITNESLKALFGYYGYNNYSPIGKRD